MKHLTRKQRGLGKYDAPLKFQHEKGYNDFKHGRVFNPFHKGKVTTILNMGVCLIHSIKILCSIGNGYVGLIKPTLSN
jgi:hypothetical protein